MLIQKDISSLTGSVFDTPDQLLHIRHDPVGFLKTHRPMKPLAVHVVQLAVAGKFLAAMLFRPAFTGGQQFAGDALPTHAFPDVDSLQIPHRAGFRSFHIVMAELALCKTHGFLMLPVQKDCRILPGEQGFKFFCHLFQGMLRPQFTGEGGDFRGI